MVPFNDSDIASLSDGPCPVIADTALAETVENTPTSRIVLNNITEDQALQINGPIGEKGWREVVQLEIKNNRAANKSIQVNHAISEEVFNQLMAARAAGS